MPAPSQLDHDSMPLNWQTVAAPRSRCPADLRLWNLKLEPDAPLDPEAWASLSPSEHVRAEGFHHQIDRVRFVYGRAAVRHLLGRHLGLDPRAVPLILNRHGKPMLAREGVREAAPYFNVSHAGERIVLACSTQARVGVDAELITPDRDLADLVRYAFSADERHYCRQGGDAAAFFAVWTAKEAVLKCWGCGLAKPIKDLCVASARNDGFEVRWRGRVQVQTMVFKLDIGDAYAAAVATGSPPPDPG